MINFYPVGLELRIVNRPWGHGDFLKFLNLLSMHIGPWEYGGKCEYLGNRLKKLIKIDSPFHNITNELDDGLLPKESLGYDWRTLINYSLLVENSIIHNLCAPPLTRKIRNWRRFMFTGILGPTEPYQRVEQCYVVSYEYSKKLLSFIA
jgi:hypothetical protein